MIKPLKRYYDNRGYFQELFRATPDFNVAQVNYSSSKKNVLRGIHCSPYSKIVQCIAGAIYDVVVDLRKDSPTYLQWQGFYMSCSNTFQLIIPKEFGHSFLGLEENNIVLYLQNDTWEPGKDKLINPLDETLNINWDAFTMGGGVVMSEQDRNSPNLCYLDKQTHQTTL
jgi:dTDP-4-dehydrorhamnose 3,5-epimerase